MPKMTSSSAEDHRKQYKNVGKDSQELRRRRAGTIVAQRKSRKDEQLTERRNIHLNEADVILTSTLILEKNEQNDDNLITKLGKITQHIFSGIPEQELIACQMTREMLCPTEDHDPQIDPVIKSGIIPKCIELLKSSNSDTQLESSWIITNVASGNSTQTNYVVEHGAVDPLIELLKHSQIQIVEHAVWALGNIAGDGTELRDMLIYKGIIPPLVELVKTQSSTSFLPIVSWTLCNLCDLKTPMPSVSAIRQILPALTQLIMCDDTEIVSETAWALSCITDAPVPIKRIDEVVESGVLARVVRLLNSPDRSVIKPCLRLIGNILIGNDSQTDAVLTSGPVLQILGKLLLSPSGTISNDSAWAISNITAGTMSQTNQVVNLQGIVPSLIHIIQNGSDFPTQKDALWAVRNITCHGSLDHIQLLHQHDAIPALSSMLKCKDRKIVVVAMNGLENMLRGLRRTFEKDLEDTVMALKSDVGRVN